MQVLQGCQGVSQIACSFPPGALPWAASLDCHLRPASKDCGLTTPVFERIISWLRRKGVTFERSVTMERKTCLVTGVAGFVGSHLAERLIRDGHFVIGVDCFSDYYPRWMKENNLAQLRRDARFHFIEADLLELDLAALLRGESSSIRQRAMGDNARWDAGDGHVDYVFHLAAQAGVRESWGRNFDIYVRSNILTTQRLLEAAKELPLMKLVYASSSSVYGDAEAFPTSEDVTPHPVSPYGVTKLAGEHLCLLYWRNYGVPAVGLRYFTVYGPRQRPDMAFHRFIRAILEGMEIPVYGDGEQTRDFTYVDDAG